MRTQEEVSDYNRTYYESHKDERRSYDVSRREEKRAYDAAHREEIRGYGATYRKAHREELRAYYYAHRDEVRERHARKQRWFTDNLSILRAVQGCGDCETHEGNLEHHHLDPDTKKCKISEMCNYSLEKFMDEIAKCAVLCVPCHNKRHVATRGGGE